MEYKIILQVMGAIILLFGFIFTYSPDLISNKPIPEDTFRAIERRVWWGLLIGLGMLFMFHHQVKPYLFTVAALGMTLSLGVLVSRLIGIALDGSVPRQWMWVAVELGMVIAFGIWYVKQRL